MPSVDWQERKAGEFCTLQTQVRRAQARSPPRGCPTPALTWVSLPQTWNHRLWLQQKHNDVWEEGMQQHHQRALRTQSPARNRAAIVNPSQGHTAWMDTLQQFGKDLSRLHPCGSMWTDTVRGKSPPLQSKFPGADGTSLLAAPAQLRERRKGKIWQG